MNGPTSGRIVIVGGKRFRRGIECFLNKRKLAGSNSLVFFKDFDELKTFDLSGDGKQCAVIIAANVSRNAIRFVYLLSLKKIRTIVRVPKVSRTANFQAKPENAEIYRGPDDSEAFENAIKKALSETNAAQP